MSFTKILLKKKHIWYFNGYISNELLQKKKEDTRQVFPIYHFIYHIFALRAMQILSMGEGDKCEKQKQKIYKNDLKTIRFLIFIFKLLELRI